jgi:hypothetical protein
VLSGKGLCDELITGPRGVIYWLWHVLVWDQETSCDEVAKKKRTEPMGNTCRKNQQRNLGQNKITS